MNSDIALWVRFCPKCQSCKVSRHNRARLSNYPTINNRMHTVHTDLVGPLRPSKGFRYVLTIRDRATGFLAATPLKDKSALSVVTAFNNHFIGIFGVPTIIISDNGKEFCAHIFKDFCKSLGVTHKRVTTYHPQSNGYIERAHRILKVALRALEDPSDWADELPKIILAINNQRSDESEFTPHQQTFGMPGRVPGIFFFDQPSDTNPNTLNTYAFMENMRYHHRTARPLASNQPYIEKNLFNCDKVWVRNDASKPPLAPIYNGPFKVIRRAEKYFILLTPSGISKVSIDRCKVAYEQNINGRPGINNNNQTTDQGFFKVRCKGAAAHFVGAAKKT